MIKFQTLLISVIFLSACTLPWQKGPTGPPKPEIRPPTESDAAVLKKYDNLTATLRIPGLDSIVIDLLPLSAPLAVANFINLAEAKYYDNTIVHRVVPSLMIEAGDPTYSDQDPNNDGTGSPGYTFALEIDPQLKMEAGVVAMANNGPDTNASRFFILVADSGAPWLDGRYTIFGRVTHGLDMARSISQMGADANGRLVSKITIENVIIDKVEHPEQPSGLPKPKAATDTAGEN